MTAARVLPTMWRAGAAETTRASTGRGGVMGDDAISVSDALVVLRRALPAIICGDLGALELFTEDVTGLSPSTTIRSRLELEHQLLDRQGALSRAEFVIDRSEEDQGGLVVWWRMCGDHTGELLFNEDELFEPSGVRVRLSATTRVRFRGRRVRSFDTTYDARYLLDQLRDGMPPYPR